MTSTQTRVDQLWKSPFQVTSAKVPQTLEASSHAPESNKLCRSAPRLQDKRGVVCECIYTAWEMLSPLPRPPSSGKMHELLQKEPRLVSSASCSPLSPHRL